MRRWEEELRPVSKITNLHYQCKQCFTNNLIFIESCEWQNQVLEQESSSMRDEGRSERKVVYLEENTATFGMNSPFDPCRIHLFRIVLQVDRICFEQPRVQREHKSFMLIIRMNHERGGQFSWKQISTFQKDRSGIRYEPIRGNLVIKRYFSPSWLCTRDGTNCTCSTRATLGYHWKPRGESFLPPSIRPYYIPLRIYRYWRWFYTHGLALGALWRFLITPRLSDSTRLLIHREESRICREQQRSSPERRDISNNVVR